MQPGFVPYPPGAQGLPALPGRRESAPARRPQTGKAAALNTANRKLLSPADLARLRHNATVPAAALVSLVGFYIALHTSFAGEILRVYLHFPFPIVAIFAVVVPIAVLVGGRPAQFFHTPVAKPWVFLNIWMMLCAVLSFYPRESVSEVVPYVLRLQILPVLCCAVAATSKAARSLIAATALGVLPVLILCAVKGEMQEGTRFGIAETSMSNPNDLAFHLLWGATLLLLFLFSKGKPGRIMAIVAIPSSFWFILKTASRANFLTIFAVVIVAFLLAAPSMRIVLLVTVPIGLAITLPLLPKATLQRILAVDVGGSIADVGKEAQSSRDDLMRGALGSEAARMELARLAVDATFRHPVFGVGMAMFADETASFILRTTGHKAPWQTAHNSYLKVSSENGIPGLIFYVWSILTSIAMTWRTLNQSRGRPGFEDTTRNSVCILLTLVVYTVGTFFCDIIYLPYLSITVGLSAANFLAFRNEDRLQAALVPSDNPSFAAPSFGRRSFSQPKFPLRGVR